MTTPSIGQSIPDFETHSTAEQSFKLSHYRGKKIILYFYPRDNTPGCTQEGKDFSTHSEQFNTLNTVIFGISRDSVKVHQGFKAKQDITIDLLSDKEEILCQLFDVIKTKNMYGKQVQGIERSTFLIDEEGILIAAWRKVKVKNHVDEVLQTINAL